MKRAALVAIALLLRPAPVHADELLVGSVRDQDGRPVAGAGVRAIAAGGVLAAVGNSAADGSFALEFAGRPLRLAVRAPDAEPVEVELPAPGLPVLVVVRHHRAADPAPSPADLAALPAGLLPDLAQTIPYRISGPGAIADRHLGRGRGAVTIEGLPFYRRSDGAGAAELLPAHAAGSLDERGPLEALWYGDRGAGGVVDARVLAGTDALRLSPRDDIVRAGSAVRGTVARSWDADGTRSLIAANAHLPAGDAGLSLTALAGSAPAGQVAGLGLSVDGQTPLRDLALRVALTRDDDARARGDVRELVADERGRGAQALAVRLRVSSERGAANGPAVTHDSAAVVLGTERGTALRVRAAVALAYGADRGGAGPDRSGAAVLPMVAADAPFGRGWSVHAGATAASLGTPGSALALAHVAEAGLRFDDRHRLRAEFIAYAERDAAPRSLERGLAASAGWQIAPRLALRAWAGSDVELTPLRRSAYPGAPAADTTVPLGLQPRLAWITWDGPLRVDALLRSGALEGSLRLPLAPGRALVLGSARPRGAARMVSAGLVLEDAGAR